MSILLRNFLTVPIRRISRYQLFSHFFIDSVILCKINSKKGVAFTLVYFDTRIPNDVFLTASVKMQHELAAEAGRLRSKVRIHPLDI